MEGAGRIQLLGYPLCSGARPRHQGIIESIRGCQRMEEGIEGCFTRALVDRRGRLVVPWEKGIVAVCWTCAELPPFTPGFQIGTSKGVQTAVDMLVAECLLALTPTCVSLEGNAAVSES